MKNDIFVSIVMPAYNAEKYIGEAIESVLNQTYSNYELIIVDDASKDQTANIVKKLVVKTDNIRFYQNEKNKGVSYTRNFAISKAYGDWIAFLDSDDKWHKEKLEKQVKLLLDKPNAKLVFTGSAFIDKNSNRYSYILKVPEKISQKELFKQNIISCSSVLTTKEYLQKIQMHGDEMHEDFAVWLQILKFEDFAYGINEPLLLYRITQNSKSANKFKSAKMTFQVYRTSGLNGFRAVYYMIFYTYRSIKKYRNIKLKGK